MSFIRKIKRNGKTYLAEVKNERIDGKVVQKHVRYIGKEVDGKEMLSSSLSNLKIDSVKLYGPLLVLNHIADELKLKKHLGKYSAEILSLVYAHCINPKSINKMEDWFKKTDLNMILDIDNVTEKRLLNALDSFEKMDFERVQNDIFQEAKNRYHLKNRGVVYDVTNTYLYGNKCPLGKLGKDKEGVRGRPLIQIGLAVTRGEGIPVFHKTFDGNISDSKTLHDLITSFSTLKVRKGIIIYDRGITSAANIVDLKAKGWETICGVKSSVKLKAIHRKHVERSSLVNIKNRVRLNKTVFYVTELKHTIAKVSGSLFICYNEQKEKDIRESRYDEIVNAHNLLSQGKKIKEGLEVYFYANNAINHRAIKLAEEFDGFTFVFSSAKLGRDEVMRLYFSEKDIVEKAFQNIKGITGLRPIRHWLYSRVTAHVSICYLSYLLLSVLKFKLVKIDISPIEALSELDTMYRVYIRDPDKGFKISRTVTLSKKQETILKTINRNLLKM